MIEVGKYAGFCGGVINSVTKTKKALEEYNPLYCLGELVHNKQVVDSLKEKGLIIVDSLSEVEDYSTVVIRAHGVAKEVYEEAKDKNIHLMDLTCPKVLKIHEAVREYYHKGYFIVLVGSRVHPEVIGTVSNCRDNSYIIENLEEVEEVVSFIKKNDYQKVAMFFQTTYSVPLAEKIIDVLQEKLKDREVLIRNTICNATTLRQEECKKMAQEKDCMIIIGGRNSSNTKKLYEVSSSYCQNTYIVETASELDKEELSRFQNIGVMAGASTPVESIEEVVELLKK